METQTKAPATQVADVTMYGLTKLVNAAGVKALGSRWSHVREQHMYNYRKNGMVKGLSTDGKLTKVQAETFAAAFVARRKAKLDQS